MSVPARGPTQAIPAPSAWLGEGPERCEHCLQGYALEVEVRCVACDRPGCPHCVVRVRRQPTWILCPACAEEGGGDGSAAEDGA